MGKQRSDNDPDATDIDEIRREIARKAANIMQAWRTCRRPPCKRGRRCTGRLTCPGVDHLREPPAHKHPAIIASIYRQVKRMIAARGEPDDR